MLRLTSHATVAQMLARADFKKRLSKNEDISLLEFMYPLLQGYDSVKVEADIEMGGTDQIFNLLVGRDIQKDFGQEQQVVITMPLLEGTDGVQKMSKSYANFIGINEEADEMFGKIMSISDTLMLKYFELLTDEDLESVKKMHPKEAKLKLAQELVAQYHSTASAQEAVEVFEQVFSKKELPRDILEYKLKGTEDIIAILTKSGLVKSGNEARRLINEKAITFEEKKIEQVDFVPKNTGILRVGSRRFLKIIL
jgi:tyrosyl-tRNA synthetase